MRLVVDCLMGWIEHDGWCGDSVWVWWFVCCFCCVWDCVWLLIACCDGLNMMGDAVLACECVVVYGVCDSV